MKRIAFLIAAANIAACPNAAEPSRAPPACVFATSCGCSILVAGGSCPGGSTHFFRDLTDGAPLQFDLGRGTAAAISTQPQSNIFSPGPRDSWTDSYRFNGGNITIHYAPGSSTCSKLAQGEQCEYFDVRAQVLFSGPDGVRSYAGVGKCGC